MAKKRQGCDHLSGVFYSTVETPRHTQSTLQFSEKSMELLTKQNSEQMRNRQQMLCIARSARYTANIQGVSSKFEEFKVQRVVKDGVNSHKDEVIYECSSKLKQTQQWEERAGENKR